MNYFFLSWYLIPPFLYVVYGMSSYSAGLVFLSTAYTIFILLTKKTLYLSRIFIYIIFFSTISTIFTYIFWGHSDPARQWISLILIIIIGVCITSALNHYLRRSPVAVGRSFTHVYWVIVLIGLISLILPNKFDSYQYLTKPVFPFPEPSHFALAYISASGLAFPFLSKNNRFLAACIAVFFGLIFPNFTIIFGGLLLFLLIKKNAMTFWLTVCIAILFLSIIAMDLEVSRYLLDRLGSGGDQNLSRMVYLRGWESVYQALTERYVFGVGFQELGNQDVIESTLLIREQANGVALSEKDGGFLFSKFVSEFGYIGLIFVSFYMYIALRSYLKIRRALLHNISAKSSLELIPYMLVYLSLVEIFIRGVGYFSPTFILMIALIPRCIFGVRLDSTSSKKL
jgi:hypothetical protein